MLYMDVANNAIVVMDLHEHQQGHKYKLHGLLLCSQQLVFMCLVVDAHIQQSSEKGWTHKHTTRIKTIITLPGIR